MLDFWYLILKWVCVDEGKFSSLLLNREKRRYCVVGDLIFMSFGGVVGRSGAGGWRSYFLKDNNFVKLM